MALLPNQFHLARAQQVKMLKMLRFTAKRGFPHKMLRFTAKREFTQKTLRSAAKRGLLISQPSEEMGKRVSDPLPQKQQAGVIYGIRRNVGY